MFDQGRSQREAGRVLGLSQSTINEYLRRFRASGLPWPLAPDADEVTVAARFFTDHAPPVGARPLADWPTIHAELRRKGVTLQLLWIEYTQREPDGYPYTQCCRHYHAWADTLAPALRQVHIAGEKCFVDDAGLTMPVVGVHSRDVRDAQIFVGALGASHYWYADARWSQSLPDWIAPHVGMVEYFGGVSARLVPDHLRAGVTTACYYEPVVKPTYQDFATHFGTAILPTRVAAPRDTAKVFAAVLAVCDGQGLIGREMFAIDGVKLPSNAPTHRSGTRAEFTQRAEKLEAAAQTMLERHRETDALELEPDVAAKATARIARLTQDAQQLREWLAAHPEDRRGPTGGLRKSNRTDNASAKMATDKGVIQGYTGVAAVDAKHQIIAEAQAHGTGSEQELLLSVVEALATRRTSTTVHTADAGTHSAANLAALPALAVPALIADPDMRQRDERFADRDQHTTTPDPLDDTSRDAKQAMPVFSPSDFTYDADARTGVCPAGKSLYRKGASSVTNGYVGEHVRGAKRDGAPCALRAQCLRKPETSVVRTVAFLRGREDAETETHTMRMQQRLGTPEGREQYGQRVATVEPVFANVRYNTRLDRFTLRGRTRVNGQWLLFCLVHHIEKLSRAGYAA